MSDTPTPKRDGKSLAAFISSHSGTVLKHVPRVTTCKQTKGFGVFECLAEVNSKHFGV